MPKIGIVDYGAGNLFSLKCGLERGGAEAQITEVFSRKNSLDGVILPGVGNFGSAVRALESYRDEIVEAVKAGLPFLGICLGAQLIFERSEEDEGRGLAFLEGDVLKIPSSVKVPHMGWNNLEIVRNGDFLQGVEEGAWVYFVHSYYPRLEDETAGAATADYGVKFPAVVEKGNIFGTQFHPEKSGSVGSRILNNFIEVCRR